MPQHRMELVAVNLKRQERIRLDGASAQMEEDAQAFYRVVIHALFFGIWKDQEIRVMSIAHPHAKICEDVTTSACVSYLQKHPSDDGVRAVSGKEPYDRNAYRKKTTTRDGEEVIDVEFEIVK